ELKHLLQRKYGQNLTIPKAVDRRPVETRPVGEAVEPRPLFTAAEPSAPKADETSTRLRPLLTRPPDGSEPPAPPSRQVPPVIEPEMAPKPEEPKPPTPVPQSEEIELEPFDDELFEPKPLSKQPAEEAIEDAPDEIAREQSGQEAVEIEEPEEMPALGELVSATDPVMTDSDETDDELLFDEPRPMKTPIPAAPESEPEPPVEEKA